MLLPQKQLEQYYRDKKGMIVVNKANELKARIAFEEYQKKKSEWVQNGSRIRHITIRKCIRPLLRLLLFA